MKRHLDRSGEVVPGRHSGEEEVCAVSGGQAWVGNESVRKLKQTNVL